MAESLGKLIEQCHAITLSPKASLKLKIDEIKKPLASINSALDSASNEGFIRPDHISKLLEIIMLVLEKARMRPKRLLEALVISCKLTKYNAIKANEQLRLIRAIHLAFGKLDPKDPELRKLCVKRMVEIVCNLVLDEGCHANILSYQTSATTILSICQAGFKLAPEAVECSKLLKAVLMNWPAQFLGKGLIPGQKKSTTSIVIQGSDADWPSQKLEAFIELAVENYCKLAQQQVEAKRGLRFAITRALSLDHKLVWKVLKDKMDLDAEQFVEDHLNEWFQEIGSNLQLNTENTILSCHLLLKMISLDDSARPTLYEHYVEHIIAKTVLLISRLANYHATVFTPENCNSNRLEPCDRMISQMLYKFVMVQSNDPDWQDKLLAYVTPQLEHQLVNTLAAACSRRVFMVRGPEGKLLAMEPPDEDDETFWGHYHDMAFRILNGQQRASFGYHLRPDKTFEKLKN